jgi:CRISP-associated protein Cas1
MGEQTDTHQMAVGSQAHTASDDPTASRRHRTRAVEVASNVMGVVGRCDTVEWNDDGTATVIEQKATPVRRRPDVTEPMVVQLALQVAALREAGVTVSGATVAGTGRCRVRYQDQTPGPRSSQCRA